MDRATLSICPLHTRKSKDEQIWLSDYKDAFPNPRSSCFDQIESTASNNTQKHRRPVIHSRMHFRSFYLLALNVFITRTLATPAALSASTLDISKRLYFPGCIAALRSLNTGPCTCKCDSGYGLTANKPYHQESEMMCQARNGNFYGPVGKPLSSTHTWLKCSLCAALSHSICLHLRLEWCQVNWLTRLDWLRLFVMRHPGHLRRWDLWLND